ncbi:hypothetical protein [Reinekea thalattae]|uniref:Uncharacterized protein n=1 Tax=Reinekea thalattae TaxID=2593301 RepID=A0A5C8Z4F0_9GAMM|nr:hypothetical protein [Reinekea thalattae]TXR52051.1 hypothetical protein FME95_11590 [Reinekea thalattae]
MDDFEVLFSSKFTTEFECFPIDQQEKILSFAKTFQDNGLSDFSIYEGKVTPSWKGGTISDKNYQYALDNDLWHYHVGIPEYEKIHDKYKTSDWLLHFQWPNRGNEICLVDLYSHYTSGGEFYLPPETYLGYVEEE